MIDTTDHNAASEYARMLGVLMSVLGFACGISQVSKSAGAIWLIVLCVAVGLRSLGPVGKGIGRTIFTAAVLLSLLIALFVFRESLVGAISAAMLFFIGLKLVGEAAVPTTDSEGNPQA